LFGGSDEYGVEARQFMDADFEGSLDARDYGLEAAVEERSPTRDYDTLLRAREIIDEILSPSHSARNLYDDLEDAMVRRGSTDLDVTVRYPAQRMGWVWTVDIVDSPTFGLIKDNIIHYFGIRGIPLQRNQMKLLYNGAEQADSSSLLRAPYRTGEEIQVVFPNGGPPRATVTPSAASAKATSVVGNEGKRVSPTKKAAAGKAKGAGGKAKGAKK
jgi:hypothetical protein